MNLKKIIKSKTKTEEPKAKEEVKEEAETLEEEVPEIEQKKEELKIKEKLVVVKELPTQTVRSYIDDEGIKINMITTEEALTQLIGYLESSK